MQWACPTCSTNLDFSQSEPGSAVACPTCQSHITVPLPQNAYQAPATPTSHRRSNRWRGGFSLAGGILLAVAVCFGGCVLLTGGGFMYAVGKANHVIEERQAFKNAEKVAASKLVVEDIEVIEGGSEYHPITAFRARVTNKSGQPISVFYMHIVAQLPGRTVPLQEGDVVGLPKAGIERGETLEVKCFPGGLFEDQHWNILRGEKGLVLTCTMNSILDAKKSPITN